ncbi:hypothetical protein ACJ73_08929, partial [Blastomyces percursus]
VLGTTPFYSNRGCLNQAPVCGASSFKENPTENWSKQDSQQVWDQYSRLPANHRTTFQNFYYGTNKPLMDQEKWMILHLEPIKRVIRTGIFGRNKEDVGLRVFATRKNMGQSSSDGPVQVLGRDEDEEVSVPPIIDEPDKEILPVPPYRSVESGAKHHSAENRKHGSERSDISPARDSRSPQRGHRRLKSRHRIMFQDDLSGNDDSFSI